MKHLDGWIRGRLRSYRIKQRKRKFSIKTFLTAHGVSQRSSWSLACSRKGWWRKSLSHAAHQALNLKYFERNNLFSMYTSFVKHKSETAVCDSACTVVWEGDSAMGLSTRFIPQMSLKLPIDKSEKSLKIKVFFLMINPLWGCRNANN